MGGPPFTNPTAKTNDSLLALDLTLSTKMVQFRLPLKRPSLKLILIWKLPKKNWLLPKLKSPKDPKSKKLKLKSPLRLSKLCSSKLLFLHNFWLDESAKIIIMFGILVIY